MQDNTFSEKLIAVILPLWNMALFFSTFLLPIFINSQILTHNPKNHLCFLNVIISHTGNLHSTWSNTLYVIISVWVLDGLNLLLWHCKIPGASHPKHFPLSLVINAFHMEVHLRFVKSDWCSQITLPFHICSFTGNKKISFVMTPRAIRVFLLLRLVFSSKSFQH